MKCAFSFLEAMLINSPFLSRTPLKQLLPPPDGVKDLNHVETQLKVNFGVLECIMISTVPALITGSATLALQERKDPHSALILLVS